MASRAAMIVGRALVHFRLALVAACTAAALVACRHVTVEPSGDAHANVEAVPEGRLPAGVRPLAYALSLTIDPKVAVLSGTARIRIALDAPRSRFFLHGRALTVRSAELVRDDGARIPATYREVSSTGVAELVMKEVVPAGEVTLELAWTAPIDQVAQDGAFRVEVDGERYVFTQLEATLARRVFPGFDEPAWKTPFTLALEVPASDVALANTPVESEVPSATPGMKRVTFAPTPPLPTYLLAFAVGPLDVVRSTDVPPNQVRSAPLPLCGVTVKGRGGRLAHSLHVAADSVTVLERYFGLAFPFPKLDVVAIPGFTGAMENAGLATFAETYLFVDPARSSVQHLRRSATTIAHELAHHWVGDLATMPWWDDLWLNEAFASWVEAKVVDGFAPELDPGLPRLEGALEAMDLDRLASTRRVRQPVESHDDVMNAFDGITYSKGAAVLGMCEGWLGEDTFRRGVHAWLDAHRYGSSTAADLLAALAKVSGRDVATPFATFLDQPGVPLLDVKVRCTDGRAEAVVTQSRELGVGGKGDDGARWQIPWCWVRSLGNEGTRFEQGCALLRERTEVVPLGGTGCAVWVHPNAGAKGYLRFQVEPAAWRPLVDATLSKLDRDEQLVLADAIEAAFTANRLPASEVLALLPRFAASKDRAVAEAPRAVIELVRDRMLDRALVPKLEAWVRSVYGPTLPDTPLVLIGTPRERERQAAVVEIVAELGRDRPMRDMLARAAERYLGIGQDAKVHEDALAPDLVEVALGVLAEDGGDGAWDAMVALLHGSGDATLHRNLLRALGSVEKVDRAARARSLMLELRDDDLMEMLGHHVERAVNAEDTWQWLKGHLAELRPRVSEEYQYALGHVPAALCTSARKAELAGDAGKMIAALPGGPRMLESAMESIDTCAALVEAQRASATAFFANR